MAKEAQNSTREGNMTTLPHIDISSPEAARKSIVEFRLWEREASPDFEADLLRHVPYVRCCLDSMRFPNAHKSEAMKQAAQEAIDKLKAMLADTSLRGR